MKSRTCLGTLVVMLALASTANAAALLVNASGILTGANGVNVGGTLYNVEFVDDTCAAAFTGCDATSDFTFTPQFTAQLASQALLDQVFLDGSAGNFDTHPELTLGCDSFQCAALIPFFAVQTEFTAIAFINSTSLIDTTAQGIAPNDTGYSTAGNNQQVWARWTPAAVPEPASPSLLVLGLAGLGTRQWRQRKP